MKKRSMVSVRGGKAMKKILVMVCMVLFLETLLPLSAAVGFSIQADYKCHCIGRKYFVWWDLFKLFPLMDNCGNGFTGGNVGGREWVQKSAITHFIPQDLITSIDSNPGTCAFSPNSGWNCAKMRYNNDSPDCVYQATQ